VAKSGTFYSTKCIYYTIAKTDKVFSLQYFGWEIDTYGMMLRSDLIIPETVGSNRGLAFFKPGLS
jgi:hypothetical protein